MLFTNKLRSALFRFSYFETILIVAVYLGIGYVIEPHDICMLKSDMSYLIVILAIITFFHGVGNGLLAIALIGIAIYFGYESFEYKKYLELLILLLIFGEFHYYWQRIIDRYKTEAKFTENKLNELKKAFYMLKISHDQLEKNYVTKPMSLRNSIRHVKESLRSGEAHKGYQEFLSLLQKTLNIEIAHLGIYDAKGRLNVVANIGQGKPFNPKDMMIDVAYEKAMPIYVNGSDSYGSKDYIAAIPAISQKRVIGMLVIEKMPFMSFNKDNLITMNILLTYLFEEFNKLAILEKLTSFLPRFQENFRFEMHRLLELNRKFGIQSSVLVFRSKSDLEHHLLLEHIAKNLRALDIMSHYSDAKVNYVAVLFPFANISSTVGFVKRVLSLFESDVNSKVHYSTFDISKQALIAEYTGQ